MRPRRDRPRVPGTVITCAAGSVAAILLVLSGHPRATEAAAGVPAGQNVAPPRQPALPDGVEVSDSLTVDLGAGEVQSTVVPPGKNPACPQGRLIISDDYATDPAKVALVDLDNLTSVTYSTNFAGPPRGFGENRSLASHDHDLIALPDGTVVMLKMGRTKAALDPRPAWFEDAYKMDKGVPIFGPGARSEIFVWRSIDCGQSFTFVSGIDTALIDDAYGTLEDWSGGLPQLNGSTFGFWNMGGTDGPLARVDPITGRLYVTIGLVGFRPLDESPFTLSDKPLNRTVIMMSDDQGSTWQRAGVRYHGGWRVDIVPRQNGWLSFAHSGSNESTLDGAAFVSQGFVGFVQPPGQPELLPTLEAPEKQGFWGWNTHYCDHDLLYNGACDQDTTKRIGINMLDRTILTRSPGSNNLLLAYMDTLEGAKGDGFRMYLFGGAATWTTLPPIAPEAADADNYVFHVTPIDPGRGPLFFYWYDVNTATQEVTIRGRLQTRDNMTTTSFGVSRGNSLTRRFSVKDTTHWYGDYHTAGGYVAPSRQPLVEGTYHYYPVWVEPDGKVHFTHVTFERPITVAGFGHVRSTLSDTVFSWVRIDPSQLLMEREEEPLPPRR